MRTRRCDVARRCETGQQNDRVAIGQGSLRDRQRVHVIKRRGNQRPFKRPAIGTASHLHDPEMALMLEYHAFRPTAGTRCVQEHCRRVRIRYDSLEWSPIEQRRKIVIERKRRQIYRTERMVCFVAQHQLRITIAEDRCNSSCRQLPVYRHSDESSPHDTEKGGEELRAIGGQDRYTLALS